MAKSDSKKASGQTYTDMISVISRTLAAANRLIAKLLVEEGIDNLVPSHGDILIQLFAKRELTMTELANSIGKDPSTVTTLVKKLADSGYVRTRKCSTDKRITIVTLNEKGENLESKVMSISDELMNAMVSGIPSNNLDVTKQTLLEMKSNFENKTCA